MLPILKKPRRPSTNLYDSAAQDSQTDLIKEKDDHADRGYTGNDTYEMSVGMNARHVRWLSSKGLLSSWERWIWILVTVLLGVVCIVLGVQLGKAMDYPPVYKDTDFVVARKLAVEERRSFHTTATVLENGTLTFPTAGMKYIGPPSQKIDDAWAELMKPQVLALSDEEAGEMKDLSVKNEFGKRIMSLYVYHTLHCVNMVRKSFDYDYYYKDGTKKATDDYRGHIYHCLDDIRQNIMCRGDLTPVPFYWDEHMKWPLSNTTQEHTCRVHEPVREWAMARRVGHGGSPLGLPVDMKEHDHH